MVAFATLAEFETLTQRTFTNGEVERVEALLEAASDHLRSVIGQQVFPRQTVTYTAYPSFGREDLPQWPVVSVGAVERDGVPVSFKYRPGFITVGSDEPCDVTFTFGVAEAPAELSRIVLALTSQALTVLEMGLGASVGGLSSIALDDFRAAFADGGAGTGIAMTAHAEAAVRRAWGRGDVSVVEASG